MSADRPIAIDLFAGAGGLSLGFEQAGFDVVAAVELDPVHAAIHEHNFPDCAVMCRDIAQLSGREIRDAAGIGRKTVDVVVGGPPCQGFSLIGKRVLGDPRNTLVGHFLRLVIELKPRTFVMENVPGMAAGRHTQLVEELIDCFVAAGYRVPRPYRILKAAEYGVPQDRDRLFIIGSRKSGDTRIPTYPKPSSRIRPNGPRKPTNGRTQTGIDDQLDLCPSAFDAIGDLPDIDGFVQLLKTDELETELGVGSEYARMLRGDDLIDAQDYSYRRTTASRALTGCRRARHTELSRKRFAETEPGTAEPISRFFKLHRDGICNTLRAGTATDRGAFTAPRPIHYEHPRCISIREAARLHSYPDWMRFHHTIWHGFRQIGNSVPPLLARAVGSSIMEALGTSPTCPRDTVATGPTDLARMNMREAARRFGVSPHVIAPRKRRNSPRRARKAGTL